MPPGTRPDYKLNLDGLGQLSNNHSRSNNTSTANSPSEQPAGSGLRYPQGNSLGNGVAQAGTGRAGAGSPSKEYGSRLFPKRGHSTPLRETIPESPSSDSFPDFDGGQPAGGNSSSAMSTPRRTRAGTMPSRFPGLNPLNSSQSSLSPQSGSRPGSATNSFQASSSISADQPRGTSGTSTVSNAALLSRLRAGSMPQRGGYLHGSNPFGTSLFASNWMAGRDRASTLQSIRSSDAPSSPRDSSTDNDVRTLDYLGLVDAPSSGRASLGVSDLGVLLDQQSSSGVSIADLAALNNFNKNTANRFRSFSVNAKEKYADADNDALDQYNQMQQMYPSPVTPNSDTTAAQAAEIHEAVRQHNLDVQAFANFASANRPRARTAGVLDSPTSRILRNHLPTPSRLDNSITAAELQADDDHNFNGLDNALQNLHLNGKSPFETGFESGMETPTRALWLGNIPSSTTVSSLNVFFGQFGTIEFARVLTHKSCGFVNFENLQSAIAAKAQCNGKEVFPGCGPIRIGFAKEQSTSNTPGATGIYLSPSPDPLLNANQAAAGNSAASSIGNINIETAAAALMTPNLSEMKEEVYGIVQQFGTSAEDLARITNHFNTAIGYHGFIEEMPPIPEPSHTRTHDAPRLREIRKNIDNNACSPIEIENIAMEMLPEIAELSSDYLGNTVVQKLFEHCSEDTKCAMLEKIAPHLPEIGVHKNGTWAAQKIIDVAKTDKQMRMIEQALRPHGVNLLLDQYGNYVMQCCLRFRYPMNNFIFDVMLSRLWDVAQGRFGARAMRACLESHFATNDQKKLMAAAIALHSVQLATSSNGALLLTWFLDTCTFPKRRSVLAPRLIPHLVHLCTHKVAYLTVLKIVNQRNEADARDSILRALFFDDQTLTNIISDQTCGATLIFKVLTTPFLDDTIRPECIESVRTVLLRIKAQPTQGYKRLMDEVGLLNRHGGVGIGHDERSKSQSRPNGQMSHRDTSHNSYGRPMYNSRPQQQQDQGLHRTMSVESNGFEPYVNGLVSSQYTHSPSVSAVGIGHINPQVQYQQTMLAQAQARANGSRPPGFYDNAGAMAPMNPIPSGVGFGSSSNGPPMMDPYRQGISSSPMFPAGMNFQQQTYVNPMLGMGGYGQYQMPQFYQQGQMQGHMGDGGTGRSGRCWTSEKEHIVAGENRNGSFGEFMGSMRDMPSPRTQAIFYSFDFPCEASKRRSKCTMQIIMLQSKEGYTAQGIVLAHGPGFHAVQTSAYVASYIRTRSQLLSILYDFGH
nr:pumilio domain-containing protein c56f2.08c [Quercus suber]